MSIDIEFECKCGGEYEPWDGAPYHIVGEWLACFSCGSTCVLRLQGVSNVSVPTGQLNPRKGESS